jgi:hypothetical protein
MDEHPLPKKPWLQTVPGVLTAVSTSVVALAAIIGNLTPAVRVISDFFLPKGCANRSGYPAGRWVVQDLKTTTAAQYSTFIMFTDQQRGTWIASAGTGNFTASNAPIPHAKIILTMKPDAESRYESTNTLVVSADGCRMEGTFQDTEGHFGEVTYVLATEQKPSGQ